MKHPTNSCSFVVQLKTWGDGDWKDRKIKVCRPAVNRCLVEVRKAVNFTILRKFCFVQSLIEPLTRMDVLSCCCDLTLLAAWALNENLQLLKPEKKTEHGSVLFLQLANKRQMSPGKLGLGSK